MEELERRPSKLAGLEPLCLRRSIFAKKCEEMGLERLIARGCPLEARAFEGFDVEALVFEWVDFLFNFIDKKR